MLRDKIKDHAYGPVQEIKKYSIDTEHRVTDEQIKANWEAMIYRMLRIHRPDIENNATKEFDVKTDEALERSNYNIQAILESPSGNFYM